MCLSKPPRDICFEQIEAGADVVKIFDSWAGVLDDEGFREMGGRAGARDRRAREGAAAPHVPVIAFPKGAGARLIGYAEKTGVDAVAIDWTMPMTLARD